MTQKSKMISLWEYRVSLKKHPRLEGVAGCEVLVIGGGMAGILTANRLASEGVDVIVAESYRVGSGVTAGTTAKITSQHGLVYQKLVRGIGPGEARLYLEVNEAAISEYARLCENGGDSCEFQRTSNLIYSRRGEKVLEAEMKALDLIGCNSARLRSGPSLTLPFEADGAVEFPLQARFNPRKLLKRLAEGDGSPPLKLFENTRITALRRYKDGGWEAVSEHGTILADQVVVATHFPFMDRRGGYFARMYQSRSFVIAGSIAGGTEAAGDAAGRIRLDGMYLDEQEGGLSFREAEGLLLMGGGSGRPGKADGGWDDLERQAAGFYPGWKTRYRWAAQDCMTLDGMPYIGQYYGRLRDGTGKSQEDIDSQRPGLWTATGFNKWGMTGSMAGAMILTDLICGRKNQYAQLFQPARSILKMQLLVNVAESAAGLLKPKVPRCRHLGCALNWNEEEMVWECPCHGSRYDETGRCIEGPSVKDLF